MSLDIKDLPRDPRLKKQRSQNNLFDETPVISDVNYQPKAIPDEQGFAHELYQNNPISTDTAADEDFYSQTTVEEIPQPGVTAQPKTTVHPSNSPENTKTRWQKFLAFIQKHWILSLLALASLSAFLVALGLFITNQPPSISYQNVTAVIQAPTTVSNNGESVWKIEVSNAEAVDIKDVEISLQYDKTFTFVQAFGTSKPTDDKNSVFTIPLIAAGSSQTIEISGSLSGDVDEITFMSGNMKFLTNNSSTVFEQKITTVQTKIALGEVELSVSLPATVQDGTVREIMVEITNQSERDFKNTELRVTYPSVDLFEYQSSEFTLSTSSTVQRMASKGNNVWKIENLPKLRTQKLVVRGKFFGQEGSKVPFEFRLVSVENERILAEQKKETRLAIVPIDLAVSIRGKDTVGIFEPGERLEFEVNYTNQSSQALNNVQLTVDISDPANVLDFSTIRYSSGQGNLSQNSISYRGSGVPEFVTLSPRVSGKIAFSIQVKSDKDFITKNTPQNQFIITPSATILADSVDKITSEALGIKATGALTFNQTADCKPGQTGSETVCLITWKLNSRQTNISAAKIETATNLPPNSWDEKSVKASQGSVSYNSNTGRIVWDVGRVASYSGLFVDAVTVTFELKITSPEGGNTTLFSAPRITAEDEFTGQQYNFTGQPARP